MPIRFKCPNPSCRRALVVKDHLAGKKAACPACKKPLTVPKPAAAVNIEDLAAAALADAPAATTGAAEQPKSIRLECPFCAEEVEFPLEQAGKQAPCPNPECRRIIKVPAPAEKKAADWRQAGISGPAGAKENIQKVLEAQQAANIKRGQVSLQSLEEAGALPIEEELVTTADRIKRWARRVVVTAAFVGIIAGGWAWLARAQQAKKEQQALRKALEWISNVDPQQGKLSPEMKAELLRGAGDYFARQPDSRKNLLTAHTHFRSARSMAGLKAKPSPVRDLLLGEQAVNLLELAGTPDQVQDKVRLGWPEVHTELFRTLENIRSIEGGVIALRAVGGKLLERDKGEIAVGLALKMSSNAGEAFKSQEVAFLLALDKADQANKELKLPDKAGAPLGLAARMGHAEGKARLGNFEEARQFALYPGVPLDRFKASLGVAAVALEGKKTAQAAASLQDALQLLQKDLKGAKIPPLLLWQAARVAAQAGSAEEALDLAGRIADPELKARGELEVLYRRLADGGPADPDVVKDRKALAYAQALEAVARFKTRQGRVEDIQEGMDDYDELLHPFVYLGIALGERDRH
jgi:hypothetical protein